MITAVALCAFALAFALLCRGHSTVVTAAAFVMSIVLSCSCALAGEEVSFAAMSHRQPVTAAAADSPLLDFACMARRPASMQSAAFVPAVSFTAMARRQDASLQATAAASCPGGVCPLQHPAWQSKSTNKPTGLANVTYWHSDGAWRDFPQPGLVYGAPAQCSARSCFAR